MPDRGDMREMGGMARCRHLCYPVGVQGADQTEVIAADYAVALGSQLGPFRVLRRLGEGGFGLVYLAEQQEPVQRQVAIKVIRIGRDTRDVIARFEAERQALAMMDHPGIARIYEAGSTDNGRPYFVMEYVDGEPINVFCDRERLSLDARCALFIEVCQAVLHAHTKGILHRDLKPSNILVRRADDGSPRATIIDFGVARSLEQPLFEEGTLTLLGDLVGTPEYMSPEQAGLHPGDLDTRADVYALGVILYELFTGQVPFTRHTLRRIGLEDMLRQIRDVEAAPPSRTWQALDMETARERSRARSSDPRTWLRLLQGDLDQITLKATAKDREFRYGSVALLAQDLVAYRNHEPVSAGPPGPWYRIRRFVGKYRTAFAIGTVVALLVLASAVVSTIQYVRANRAAHAEAALRAEGERLQYWTTIQLADQRIRNGEAAEVPDLLWETPRHLRGWEWGYLMAQCPLEDWQVQLADDPGARVRMLPGNRQAAVLLPSGHGELWDLHPPRRRWRTELGSFSGSPLYADPRGRYVVFPALYGWTTCATEDGAILQQPVYGASWFLGVNHDGTRFYTSTDEAFTAYDAQTSQPVAERPVTKHITAIGIDPHGEVLASTSHGGSEIRLHDPLDLRPLRVLPASLSGEASKAIAVDSRLGRLVYGNWRHVHLIRLDQDPPVEIRDSREGNQEVIALHIFPESGRIAAGWRDGWIRIYDQDLQPLAEFHHGGPLHTLHADGADNLVAAGPHARLKGWPTETVSPLRPVRDVTLSRWGAAFFIDADPSSSRWIVRGFGDARVFGWDTDTDTGAWVDEAGMENHQGEAAFIPGTGELALAAGGTLRSGPWDGRDFTSVREQKIPRNILHLAFDHTGERFLITQHKPYQQVTGEIGSDRPLPVPGMSTNQSAGAISPDGRWGAAATLGETLMVWDIDSGSLRFRVPLPTLSGTRQAIAFHPHRPVIATTDIFNNILLRHAETGAPLGTCSGHSGFIQFVGFSPDGQRLLSGGDDMTVRIWDWQSQRALLVLPNQHYFAVSADFSPDGRTLGNTDAGTDFRFRTALPWDCDRGDPAFYHAVRALRSPGPRQFTIE